MSIFLYIAGVFGAVLFAAAGFRACSNIRRKELCDQIAYKGRIALLQSGKLPRSRRISAFVQSAMISKSDTRALQG